MSRITLLTGGARSGKSGRALELAAPFAKRGFIATAEPVDSEMRERIRRHQQERGQSFATVEEPIDLSGAVLDLAGRTEVIVIDCLTLWVANLLHRFGCETESYPPIEEFLARLHNRPPCELILVTNETGMGIVPGDPLSRRFRDVAGLVNQRVASLADEVFFLVSGLSIPLK